MNWQLVFARLRRRTGADAGQDLMEYGLLMALIAVVAITGVKTIGDTINSVFWELIANYH